MAATHNRTPQRRGKRKTDPPQMYANYRFGLALSRVIAKQGNIDSARRWAAAWGTKTDIAPRPERRKQGQGDL